MFATNDKKVAFIVALIICLFLGSAGLFSVSAYTHDCLRYSSVECNPEIISTQCASVTSYWPFKLVSEYDNPNLTDEMLNQPYEFINESTNGKIIHEDHNLFLLPIYFYTSENNYIVPELAENYLSKGFFWHPIPYGSQADASPEYTANGHKIDATADVGKTGAAPLKLVGEYIWLESYGAVLLNDTFGKIEYQQGEFYHHGYEEWVIGIDILTYYPLHYLECDFFIMY